MSDRRELQELVNGLDNAVDSFYRTHAHRSDEMELIGIYATNLRVLLSERDLDTKKELVYGPECFRDGILSTASEEGTSVGRQRHALVRREDLAFLLDRVHFNRRFMTPEAFRACIATHGRMTAALAAVAATSEDEDDVNE